LFLRLREGDGWGGLLSVSVKDEVVTNQEDLSTKQEDLDLIVAPEGADVKLKDIISLWTTNIMQMYGEADSVDGAPVAEVCAHNPPTHPMRMLLMCCSCVAPSQSG
jgi:hypothetical protein